MSKERNVSSSQTSQLLKGKAFDEVATKCQCRWRIPGATLWIGKPSRQIPLKQHKFGGNRDGPRPLRSDQFPNGLVYFDVCAHGSRSDKRKNFWQRKDLHSFGLGLHPRSSTCALATFFKQKLQ